MAALGCVARAGVRVKRAKYSNARSPPRHRHGFICGGPAAIKSFGQAFTALDEAYEVRDGWLLALHVPVDGSLRRDGRFAQV